MKRFVVSLFFVLLVSPAAAATPMTRVVAIVDSHTITVERARVRTNVTLAGIELPPDAEEAGREFLGRELMYRWVLVEPAPNGASYVYRSPDSLAVNRAILTTWLNGPSTHSATILGWSSPSKHTATARAASPPKKQAARAAPRPKAKSRH
jgi:hypothetical protein